MSPPMVVHLAPSLRDDIMKNAKNLKGQSDPEGKYKYFVFPHLREPFHAVRVKHQARIEEICTNNAGKCPQDQEKPRVTGTKFFVNDVLKPGLIQPPSPSRVANGMQLYGEDIVNLQLVKATPEDCLGSKFHGYIIRAHTLHTVDMAYIKIRALHPYARHILMACDVAGEKGSCDDGEFFGDLTLVKEISRSNISNIALFVVRQPYIQQMSPQCFDVIRLLGQELTMKLYNETDKSPWEDPNHAAWVPQEDDSWAAEREVAMETQDM